MNPTGNQGESSRITLPSVRLVSGRSRVRISHAARVNAAVRTPSHGSSVANRSAKPLRKYLGKALAQALILCSLVLAVVMLDLGQSGTSPLNQEPGWTFSEVSR